MLSDALYPWISVDVHVDREHCAWLCCRSDQQKHGDEAVWRYCGSRVASRRNICRQSPACRPTPYPQMLTHSLARIRTSGERVAYPSGVRDDHEAAKFTRHQCPTPAMWGCAHATHYEWLHSVPATCDACRLARSVSGVNLLNACS